jgi:hypothetical protein
MGLVNDNNCGLEVAGAGAAKAKANKEVDEEKLRRKKEQRKQRREEERRQLGEERVEDFNVDVRRPRPWCTQRAPRSSLMHSPAGPRVRVWWRRR